MRSAFRHHEVAAGVAADEHEADRAGLAHLLQPLVERRAGEVASRLIREGDDDGAKHVAIVGRDELPLDAAGRRETAVVEGKPAGAAVRPSEARRPAFDARET